jgi:hypothetical protein
VLLSINFFIVQSAHIIRNTIAVLIADMNQFHSRHILFTSLWYTNWKSETVSKNKLIIFLLILEHYFEQEGEHRGNATMENGAAIPLAAKGMVLATREHQSKFGLEILLVLLVKNKVFSCEKQLLIAVCRELEHADSSSTDRRKAMELT